ncbi:MAG: DUF134 domain-containing protein [bacterium]
MARPRKHRCIKFNPNYAYFKPASIPLTKLKSVDLDIEELEAIRLKYYKNLDQVDCAKKMSISQSSFQRLLQNANSKVAEALVKGKVIKINKPPGWSYCRHN